MLYGIALVLSIAGLLGQFGVYRSGDLAHVLLCFGLAVFVIAFLRARDVHTHD